MQDVARQTSGALQLGPGTLYGCLKRMLAAHLVEESDERPDPSLDDERRRYYRITPLGDRAVRAEARRLADAVSAAISKRLLDTRKPGIVGGKA
jgi:DNA-binding PadR family transcriptional regulator